MKPGTKRGRLTVMYLTRNQQAVCKCECGNITAVAIKHLNSSHTRSCGCLAVDTFKANGLNKRPSQGELNTQHKLTESNVREIRRLYADGLSQYKIAKLFGVWQTCISHIVLRRRWAHVT